MTSYRFCRSDDVPLLVDAYNCCSRSEASAAELTVADFKILIRELDLWTSSCMVAHTGASPIAVLLAAKRPEENWIYAVAVDPEHRRQGHGRHLMTSIGQKMAILGPPRLLAEAVEGSAGAGLLEACGYRAENRFTDFLAPPWPEAPQPPPILVEITVEDALAHGLFDLGRPRSWCRSIATLRACGSEIRGLAVVSESRIEAAALYRDEPAGGRQVLGLGSATGSASQPLLGLLLVQLRRDVRGPVVVPRVAADEAPDELMDRCGFQAATTWVGYAARAVSG